MDNRMTWYSGLSKAERGEFLKLKRPDETWWDFWDGIYAQTQEQECDEDDRAYRTES